MRKVLLAYKTAKSTDSITTWWGCPTRKCTGFQLHDNTPAIELVGKMFSCNVCSTSYQVIALLQDTIATVRMTIEIK